MNYKNNILPGGITLPTAAVTGYCTVSARATEFEINPTVLSRISAAHIFSAAFHVNGRKCFVNVAVVGLSLLRPLPHRAAAERWVDVIEDTHIFSPPVAQWCHCSPYLNTKWFYRTVNFFTLCFAAIDLFARFTVHSGLFQFPSSAPEKNVLLNSILFFF